LASHSRHGPNRLSNYFETHETILQQFVSRSFVVSNELEVSAFGNGYLVIEGSLKCAGEIEHRPIHHVHRYDTFAADTNEEVSESNWPTLGETLAEVEDWYYANFDMLDHTA
jgi:hypothetical protein